MKFIANAMLGRLAVWLRIAGYDTAYRPDIEDRELLRRAKAEGRTLLTRDTRLIERRAARGQSFLVSSEDPREQLREVMGQFPPPRGARSRCPHDNSMLKRVLKKEKVKDLVPEYVYHTAPRFYRCPECGRVYWEGSHRERIEKTLDDIIKSGKKTGK